MDNTFQKIAGKRVWRQEAKLEAFAIVPVSGDETLNQGSVGKAGGCRFPPESFEYRMYFILSLLFVLQPTATQVSQAFRSHNLRT